MKKYLQYFERKIMLLGIWVARIFPRVFKPMKFFAADRMILACGYETQAGEKVMIYRPAINSSDHEICASSKPTGKRGFKPLELKEKPALGNIMHEARLGSRKERNMLVVGKGKLGKKFSKVVEQKNSITEFGKSKLAVKQNHSVKFSWQNPIDRNFWFSFLTLDDNTGKMLAGIYTKFESWKYGELLELPYYVHDPKGMKMKKGGEYKVTLYAVNKSNWVTNIDKLTFKYAGRKEK